MRVLVACEYSGVVRDEFLKLGHEAISCDLLPTDKPGPHYQGDVFDLINWNPLERFSFSDGFGRTTCWLPNGKKENSLGFDLMIAHPPCTFLCNSGVSWLHKDISRWPKLFDGAEFLKKLLNSSIPRIAVENPIMHKYSKSIIAIRPTQTIQPWMFGHAESKGTCLWLKNLPPLVETNNVKEQFLKLPKKDAQRLHYASPGKDRWKIRSTTFEGIATAMAEQWGGLSKEVNSGELHAG